MVVCRAWNNGCSLAAGEAQEDLRRRVVGAVQKGLSQTEAARVFGVAEVR